MSRPGRVFTPAAIEVIRGLADQGKSAAEIADVIGSTAASVRVRCCQLKIRLTRRGRPGLQRTQSRGNPEQTLVIVSIRQAAYADLKRKAAHMQKSAVELAGMLLETIADSDLYSAVLGNGE